MKVKVVLLSALIAPFLLAASSPPNSEGAHGTLEQLKDLEPDEMGRDRAGNVWAWVRSRNTMVLYAPDGKVLATARMAGASAIDVDHEWGITGIYDFGRTLKVSDLGGQVTLTLPLADAVGAVAWIEAKKVAIAPTEVGYRVGLLSLGGDVPVSQMGKEVPIGDEPGLQLLRNTLLEVDAPRALIYALDSFTGAFAVYRLDGTLVRQVAVESWGPAKFADFFRQTDQQAKAEGDRQRTTIGILDLEVDDAGAAWVVETCESATGKTVFLRVPLEGETSRYPLQLECCAHNFVLLGKTWLMNRVPPPGGKRCMATGSLP